MLNVGATALSRSSPMLTLTRFRPNELDSPLYHWAQSFCVTCSPFVRDLAFNKSIVSTLFNICIELYSLFTRCPDTSNLTSTAYAKPHPRQFSSELFRHRAQLCNRIVYRALKSNRSYLHGNSRSSAVFYVWTTSRLVSTYTTD